MFQRLPFNKWLLRVRYQENAPPTQLVRWLRLSNGIYRLTGTDAHHRDEYAVLIVGVTQAARLEDQVNGREIRDIPDEVEVRAAFRVAWRMWLQWLQNRGGVLAADPAGEETVEATANGVSTNAVMTDGCPRCTSSLAMVRDLLQACTNLDEANKRLVARLESALSALHVPSTDKE